MHCKGTTEAGKPCKLQAEPNSDYCYKHQRSAIIVPEQCHAYLKSGQRCKKITRRGIYCFIHHKSIEGLKIAKSTIPDVGLGLFATKEFARGNNIAPYDGDVIEASDRYDGDDYALEIKKHPPTFISARRTNTGSGRFANARRAGQGPNNAQLVYDRRGRRAHLRARVPIHPDQEITTAYGGQYWRP